jgi:hypothetical protein
MRLLTIGAPVALALAMASCGAASKSSKSHARTTSPNSESTAGATSAGKAAKVVAAVQTNIRETTLVDAKLSCPGNRLPGRGRSIDCQLHSSRADGTISLTQRDAQGKCFLYTGHAGPYSWTPANHNVVCVP